MNRKIIITKPPIKRLTIHRLANVLDLNEKASLTTFETTDRENDLLRTFCNQCALYLVADVEEVRPVSFDHAQELVSALNQEKQQGFKIKSQKGFVDKIIIQNHTLRSFLKKHAQIPETQINEGLSLYRALVIISRAMVIEVNGVSLHRQEANQFLTKVKNLVSNRFRKRSITFRFKHPGRKRKNGGSMFRHPKTIPELRQNRKPVDEDGEPSARPKRKNLPTSWDDIYSTTIGNKNWKRFRKNRFK